MGEKYKRKISQSKYSETKRLLYTECSYERSLSTTTQTPQKKFKIVCPRRFLNLLLFPVAICTNLSSV